jgi:hypothetical protein
MTNSANTVPGNPPTNGMSAKFSALMQIATMIGTEPVDDPTGRLTAGERAETICQHQQSDSVGLEACAKQHRYIGVDCIGAERPEQGCENAEYDSGPHNRGDPLANRFGRAANRRHDRCDPKRDRGQAGQHQPRENVARQPSVWPIQVPSGTPTIMPATVPRATLERALPRRSSATRSAALA